MPTEEVQKTCYSHQHIQWQHQIFWGASRWQNAFLGANIFLNAKNGWFLPFFLLMGEGTSGDRASYWMPPCPPWCHPVAAPEFSCVFFGGHRGGKMHFWRGKIQKWLILTIFSSDWGGGKWGTEPLMGGNAPHAPAPLMRPLVPPLSRFNFYSLISLRVYHQDNRINIHWNG